ncbi:unnamed protein product [Microthlaspi erraticum]|uniref:Uncharacterized protein n=1 Tax=Microthlaspi erraticum TaxID=1685480 RepID=A0A6D2L602_9BRAS|nr:unnamed protein product [Microthlaspi erraticum]
MVFTLHPCREHYTGTGTGNGDLRYVPETVPIFYAVSVFHGTLPGRFSGVPEEYQSPERFRYGRRQQNGVPVHHR